MRESVERRAYQIFESRKDTPGCQSADWQRAESELVGPLGCGFLTLDDRISVNTDVSVFVEGLIEVCAEPYRLTICGKVRPDKGVADRSKDGAGSKEHLVFRVLDLPVEINPLNVAARFNGRILEIDLPRAKRTVCAQTNAA